MGADLDNMLVKDKPLAAFGETYKLLGYSVYSANHYYGFARLGSKTWYKYDDMQMEGCAVPTTDMPMLAEMNDPVSGYKHSVLVYEKCE